MNTPEPKKYMIVMVVSTSVESRLINTKDVRTHIRGLVTKCSPYLAMKAKDVVVKRLGEE